MEKKKESWKKKKNLLAFPYRYVTDVDKMENMLSLWIFPNRNFVNKNEQNCVPDTKLYTCQNKFKKRKKKIIKKADKQVLVFYYVIIVLYLVNEHNSAYTYSASVMRQARQALYIFKRGRI